MMVHHPSTFVAKLPNHHPVSAAGELNQKDKNSTRLGVVGTDLVASS